MGIFTDFPIDDILGVRDDLGAGLADVFLLTRTWSGEEKGEGTATEESVQMLPSPRIVKLTNAFRLRQGGEGDTADIKLKMISRESYAERNLIDGTSEAANVEKFYLINNELYRVIDVEQRHVTWSVTIRKSTDQARWT